MRSALQDAASIVGLLITTEAMIADKPEDKDACYATYGWRYEEQVNGGMGMGLFSKEF